MKIDLISFQHKNKLLPRDHHMPLPVFWIKQQTNHHLLEIGFGPLGTSWALASNSFLGLEYVVDVDKLRSWALLEWSKSIVVEEVIRVLENDGGTMVAIVMNKTRESKKSEKMLNFAMKDPQGVNSH